MEPASPPPAAPLAAQLGPPFPLHQRRGLARRAVAGHLHANTDEVAWAQPGGPVAIYGWNDLSLDEGAHLLHLPSGLAIPVAPDEWPRVIEWFFARRWPTPPFVWEAEPLRPAIPSHHRRALALPGLKHEEILAVLPVQGLRPPFIAAYVLFTPQGAHLVELEGTGARRATPLSGTELELDPHGHGHALLLAERGYHVEVPEEWMAPLLVELHRAPTLPGEPPATSDERARRRLRLLARALRDGRFSLSASLPPPGFRTRLLGRDSTPPDLPQSEPITRVKSPLFEDLLRLSRPLREPELWSVATLAALSAGASPAGTPDELRALLEERSAPADQLASCWREWSGRVESAERWLQWLRSDGGVGEPWVLELHRAYVALQPAAPAQLDFVDHLLAADAETEASERLHLLESSIPAWDPLPLGRAARPEGKLRLRYLDLRERTECPAPPWLLRERALADLLDSTHLRALAAGVTGSLSQRALRAAELLDGGVWETFPYDPVALRPLSRPMLHGPIRHPSSHRETGWRERIQSLIAQSPDPDRGELRRFCETLVPALSLAAHRALEDGTFLLGLPTMEAYVSRGAQAIGVRAFPGVRPLLLIGGRHLETASPFRLRERELRFAIGAELAHIRLGHERFRRSDVWEGAWELGRHGFDLVLGVLPLWRGWKAAEKVASRVPPGVVRKVQELRSRWGLGEETPSSHGPASGEPLSLPNEELLELLQMQQLTADRVGLLLAGDVGAALRAMVLTRPDYEAELPMLQSEGWGSTLRRWSHGSGGRRDLALRTAALIEFSLSDDYTRLATACGLHL